jgi:membrane protein
LAASVLFSWYVANFGSYNKTYGSLGAIIGFMTWIWISIIVVLVGAKLNAEMEHQTARDTTTGVQAAGRRRAQMADTVGAARPRLTAGEPGVLGHRGGRVTPCCLRVLVPLPSPDR